MPAYDPRVTPTRNMGQIVDVFRSWPGALRSAHPRASFCAWGRLAAEVVADHSLDHELGEGSPLARMYERDGWVLLLGVGYDRNSSFHLAEYRAPGARPVERAAPIMEDGRRVWKRYRDIEQDSGVFAALGAAFEATGRVRVGRVGSATARLFRQRAGVDFAVRWLAARLGGPSFRV